MKLLGKILAFCFLIIAVFRILNIVDNYLNISDTFKGFFLLVVAVASIIFDFVMKRRKNKHEP